jgi:transposase
MDYEKLLSILCDAFDVDRSLILSSHRRDCTDARACLVHVLAEEGYTERTISKMTGFSQQRVNALKNGYRWRGGYEFTRNVQEVYKRLLSVQKE